MFIDSLLQLGEVKGNDKGPRMGQTRVEVGVGASTTPLFFIYMATK